MHANYTDERELVRGIRNSDVSAYDTLYWRYHEVVYLNIIKLVKDTEAARDILQDVFVALWTKRDSLCPDKSIGGWLFMTSYHKSIDYVRQKVIVPFIEHRESLIDEIIDCFEEDRSPDRFSLIEEAINQLSPQKRKVFELCKLDGKTYEETALELNISKHTVKEYLSGAIASIRNYIQLRAPQALVTTFIFFLTTYPPFC